MLSPHAGGSRIPPSLQEETRQRILKHAESHYAGRFTRLDIRFRGAFCYIDAYMEPEPPTKRLLDSLGETEAQYYARLRDTPTHLCRLRYFAGQDRWSIAFYTTVTNATSLPSFRAENGSGTPEEGFDLGAVYLQ
jgi:hypothetical protein